MYYRGIFLLVVSGSSHVSYQKLMEHKERNLYLIINYIPSTSLKVDRSEYIYLSQIPQQGLPQAPQEVLQVSFWDFRLRFKFLNIDLNKKGKWNLFKNYKKNVKLRVPRKLERSEYTNVHRFLNRNFHSRPGKFLRWGVRLSTLFNIETEWQKNLSSSF